MQILGDAKKIQFCLISLPQVRVSIAPVSRTKDHFIVHKIWTDKKRV